jgi:hypothetical protein
MATQGDWYAPSQFRKVALAPVLVIPPPSQNIGQGIILTTLAYQPITPQPSFLFLFDRDTPVPDGYQVANNPDPQDDGIMLPAVSMVIDGFPIGAVYIWPAPGIVFRRGLCIQVGAIDDYPPGDFTSVPGIGGIISAAYLIGD